MWTPPRHHTCRCTFGYIHTTCVANPDGCRLCIRYEEDRHRPSCCGFCVSGCSGIRCAPTSSRSPSSPLPPSSCIVGDGGQTQGRDHGFAPLLFCLAHDVRSLPMTWSLVRIERAGENPAGGS